MQNYKDSDGNVHFLSEADIANGGTDLLPAGCIEITKTEADELLLEEEKPTKEQLWSAYQRQAMALLAANDTVAIRCVKANVPYPKEWFDCDMALRVIVHAHSGDPTLPLPCQPITRPAGT